MVATTIDFQPQPRWKTLFPCSSTSAWFLSWVVCASVRHTVHECGMTKLFLFHAPHVTIVAPGHFHREWTRAHESCPHMFVSLYACGQHANGMHSSCVCTEVGVQGKCAICSWEFEKCANPVPPFEMCYVFLKCMNSWDAPSAWPNLTVFQTYLLYQKVR